MLQRHAFLSHGRNGARYWSVSQYEWLYRGGRWLLDVDVPQLAKACCTSVPATEKEYDDDYQREYNDTSHDDRDNDDGSVLAPTVSVTTIMRVIME